MLISRQGIGWRRPENLAIGLITAMCGLLFLSVKSDYLKILPFIVDVYGPLHLSWGMMLKKLPTFVWLSTLAVVVLSKNAAAGTRSMVRILCCAGTAADAENAIFRLHGILFPGSTVFAAFEKLSIPGCRRPVRYLPEKNIRPFRHPRPNR